MRGFLGRSIACLLPLLVATSAKVHVLKDDTFHDFVSKEEHVMVEFYAPWCGHCKRLNPILDDVSEEAAKRGLVIAKVDATANKALQDQFDVHGFPTLKFRKSPQDEWMTYVGGRRKEDFLTFAELMNQPSLTEVNTQDEYLDFLQKSSGRGWRGVLFVYDSETPESAVKTVQHLADTLFHKHSFAKTTNTALVGEGVSLPALLMVELGEDSTAYTGALVEEEEKEIKKWIGSNDALLFSEIGNHNFGKLGRKKELLVITIVDPEDKGTAQYLDGMKSIARRMSKATAPEGLSTHYTFGWLNGTRWADYVKQFNVHGDLPRVVALDMGGEKFYEDPEVKELTQVETFLHDVFEGKVPAQKEGMGGLAKRMWRKVQSMGPYALLLLLPVLFVVGSFMFVTSDVKDDEPDMAESKKDK